MPPELAAAAGIHDVSSENANIAKADAGGQSDLGKDSCARPQLVCILSPTFYVFFSPFVKIPLAYSLYFLAEIFARLYSWALLILPLILNAKLDLPSPVFIIIGLRSLHAGGFSKNYIKF